MCSVQFRRPARPVQRAAALLVAAVLTSGTLSACAREPPGRPGPASGAQSPGGSRDGTLYGAPVPVGDGSGRTYIVVENGEPTEIGIALSERALVDLPPVPPGHEQHGYVEFILPLPPDNPTPYRLVELDWNPHGHEPLAVYGAPHFDFHFYTISLEERNAIDPADPQWARKGDHLPGAGYLPAGWADTGTLLGAAPAATAIPRMGLHWLDPASPELNGQPFTTTFLYGSWDGAVIFVEPMVTLAFLESRPAYTGPVAVAQRYAVPGYHPASYRVYWDAGEREYRVALSALAKR